jgi:hypothetical protein
MHFTRHLLCRREEPSWAPGADHFAHGLYGSVRGYQVSPNGRASISKDHADGRCCVTWKTVSATSSGWMKNVS